MSSPRILWSRIRIFYIFGPQTNRQEVGENSTSTIKVKFQFIVSKIISITKEDSKGDSQWRFLEILEEVNRYFDRLKIENWLFSDDSGDKLCTWVHLYQTDSRICQLKSRMQTGMRQMDMWVSCYHSLDTTAGQRGGSRPWRLAVFSVSV